MKSLMIGQSSKEYGAATTSGAALVAIELAKNSTKDFEIALYATNISCETARIIKDFHAFGYSKNILLYLWALLRHPMRSVRHLRFYKNVMGVSPLRFFFYEVNIGRTIINYKPDIIHTHGVTQYMPAYFASNGNVPLVATLHGYWYTDEKTDRIEKATMPFISNLTTLTSAAKKDILHDYPNSFKHFEIVANGADTNKFFYSEKERRKIRNQLGVSDRTYVFITVASLQERKGQLRFLQYLNQSGIDDYRYLIIGKGESEYIEDLKQYISENSLSNKVLLLGYIDNSEMYRYYSASDFYAHVSTFEGQSLSEMEAASTGLRVIVNKPLVDTLPEDVNDNSTMYYVLDYNAIDSDEFKSWANMSIEKRHSISYYSWETIAEKYNSVFESIIGTT